MAEAKEFLPIRKILLAMLAGFTLGALANIFEPNDFISRYLFQGVLGLAGDVFVRSLQLLVVPLVLVSLICGTSRLSGRGMGRLGGKTVGLYLVTTMIAVTLALLLATMVAPGMSADQSNIAYFDAQPVPPLFETLAGIFPKNPVAAMAEGNMLQVIIFAILFGMALSKAGEAGHRIKALFEDLNTVIMRLMAILIAFTPYGVFALLATTFATLGLGAILDILAYFLTVVLVLLVHGLLMYSLFLRFGGQLNIKTFFNKVRTPALIAFTTSSSNATLPVTLNTVEHKMGVSNKVAAFSVPLGATINMDGTVIMQGVATVFLSHVYGIDMSLMDYLLVVITATAASVGTAGVPGVGLIMLTMVLQQVGLPIEGVALILSVDRLLDMLRTSVNITGDAMIACLVARSEGELDDAIFNDLRENPA